jgi:hypothetical protein
MWLRPFTGLDDTSDGNGKFGNSLSAILNSFNSGLSYALVRSAPTLQAYIKADISDRPLRAIRRDAPTMLKIQPKKRTLLSGGSRDWLHDNRFDDVVAPSAFDTRHSEVALA